LGLIPVKGGVYKLNKKSQEAFPFD
jgi:hypothetical protein